MWRKIHSKRDPGDTLYSELRKEFSTYFDKADNLSRHLFARNPKFFLGLMVFILIGSAVSAFTVFRHREPAHPKAVQQQVSPVQDGFTQIMQAAEKIRATLRLKHVVDSISSKKQFSPADSAALDSALDKLRQLRKIK